MYTGGGNEQRNSKSLEKMSEIQHNSGLLHISPLNHLYRLKLFSPHLFDASFSAPAPPLFVELTGYSGPAFPLWLEIDSGLPFVINRNPLTN